MKKLKLLTIGLALASPLLIQAQTTGAGGVIGSPHDFSTNSWNTTTSGASPGRRAVCSACHQAHHTAASQIVPLWSHATSTETFTPYTSPTMNAADAGSAPSGASLACLSCHDGVTAVNAKIDGTFTGGTAVPIDPSAVIGTDLHTTHPISITYNTALATADGGLEDPAAYTIGSAKTRLTVQTAPVPATWSGTPLTGKTIQEAMLIGNKLECSSCHDVHKQEGSAPTSGILARISGSDADGRGSLLCRTCHVK